MTYRYVFSKAAKKDLDKLDSTIKQRIAKKLQYFANQDDILSHAKPLVDHALGDYRFRIGQYRVVFDLDGHNILVHKIRHRRDVYRG